MESFLHEKSFDNSRTVLWRDERKSNGIEQIREQNYRYHDRRWLIYIYYFICIPINVEAISICATSNIDRASHKSRCFVTDMILALTFCLPRPFALRCLRSLCQISILRCMFAQMAKGKTRAYSTQLAHIESRMLQVPLVFACDDFGKNLSQIESTSCEHELKSVIRRVRGVSIIYTYLKISSRAEKQFDVSFKK